MNGISIREKIKQKHLGLNLSSEHAITFDLSIKNIVKPYPFIARCYKLNIKS